MCPGLKIDLNWTQNTSGLVWATLWGEGGVLWAKHQRGLAKRSSTLIVDTGRIERHIKPLLGGLAVAAVTRHDVERFFHDVASGRTKARVKTKARGLARVSGGKTAANRSAGLLGAIFTYAIRQGLRTDNPVHGLQRFADGRRERRLSEREYAFLGEGITRAASQRIWPPALAAVEFLAAPFKHWTCACGLLMGRRRM
jgi:hypothetical protein